ncbi:MAG: hypothetical protein ACF8OB_17630 [Phycisphaeraceae bacterium JB051]
MKYVIRQSFKFLSLGFNVFVAVFLSQVHSVLAVEPIDLEASIALSSETMEVRVDPKTGRIVYWGVPAGKPTDNLLWLNPNPNPNENGWVNWGGDRLWPTHQAGFRYVYGPGGWPDKALDHRPWKVTLDRQANSVQMLSTLSQPLGIVAHRKLHWDMASEMLLVDNRLDRISYMPFPLHIWSITQIRRAPMVLIDCPVDRPVAQRDWLNMGSGGSLPKNTIKKHDLNVLVVHCDRIEKPAKIGVFGRWIAAIYPTCIFIQYTSLNLSGAYPDGSNLQLYIDPDYVELETLSNQVMVQPEQQLSCRVAWKIMPVARENASELSDLLKVILENIKMMQTNVRM